MPDIIQLIGCDSVLVKPGNPSREVSWDQIRETEPDFIIAACCGFSADRAAMDGIPPDLKLEILDGYDYFSRPGPKLLDSIQQLVILLDKLADKYGTITSNRAQTI